MTKEDLMLKKRLVELSRIAYQREIVTFSEFLNLNELNILHSIPKDELFAAYRTFGGYETAERQMVAFLPDALCYAYEYPIAYLKVSPVAKKFSDQLSHRDYLGAVLNLGIERMKLGDILIDDEGAILITQDSMAAYIISELTRIRHTSVKVTLVTADDFTYTPNIRPITGSVASLRLDSLLALAFGSSRSKLVNYIEAGKVFVNGKLITSNGYQIKEGDIISARGLGRFRYIETAAQTKKGRNMVTIHLYV